MNVQHNCAEHACTTSGTRIVFQEREATEQRQLAVQHSMPLNDNVLNVGQMRDSILIQPFRPPTEMLDGENIIMTSTANELNISKAATKTKTKPTATTKARTAPVADDSSLR